MGKMSVEVDRDELHEIIRTKIQLEVTKALSEDPKALVAAVVESALAHKENHYDSETALQKATQQMIRDAAEETLKAWIEKNRKVIAAAVNRKLKRAPQKLADELAEKFVSAIPGSLYITVRMKEE